MFPFNIFYDSIPLMDSNLNEIEQIVSAKYAHQWHGLKPTVYYKKGKPTGLIAKFYLESEDCLYLACTTSEPDMPFTKSMLCDILSLYKQQNICLTTGHIPSQAKIASLLTKRYGFTVEYRDDVMYSYHRRSV